MKTTSADVDQAVIMSMLKHLINRGVISRREAERAALDIACRSGAKYFAVL